MEDVFAKALIEHGPIGILALAACYAVWRLATKVDILQEKRVADVEKVVTHMQNMTTAMDRNSDAIERMLDRRNP